MSETYRFMITGVYYSFDGLTLMILFRKVI